jgi:hypothetical protein
LSARLERDSREVATYMPANTRHYNVNGIDVWTFRKNTEMGIEFEISLYYDATEDTPGYCAQLVSPKLEDKWMNQHMGHLFVDGVICLGVSSMRTRRTLREAYSKSCLWAEGMAVMIQSHLAGMPSHFPFSNNNDEDEVHE